MNKSEFENQAQVRVELSTRYSSNKDYPVTIQMNADHRSLTLEEAEFLAAQLLEAVDTIRGDD